VRRSLAMLVVLAGLGCAASRESDAGVDAGSTFCSVSERPIDLLLVVQGSSYMIEVGDSLAAMIGELIEPLAEASTSPLHVAVVASDLGADSYACTPLGADGAFARSPWGARPGCEPIGMPFVEITDSRSVESVACLVQQGNDRCFNQAFESLIRSLLPTDSAVRFRHGEGGIADAANAGFLRSDSLLAVVFVGTYDDCSVRDVSVYAAGAPRCADGWVCCEERLHPLERYVGALGEVRPDRESVVIGALTGIPLGRAPVGPSELDELLALPEMLSRDPVCVGSRVSQAFPSPRIVRLVREFRGPVRSVCDLEPEQLGPSLRFIADGIIDRACVR
jgi:hypothetical protein